MVNAQRICSTKKTISRLELELNIVPVLSLLKAHYEPGKTRPFFYPLAYFKSDFYKKNSAINTTAQQTHATGKRPAPKKERIIPTASAIIPARGD